MRQSADKRCLRRHSGRRKCGSGLSVGPGQDPCSRSAEREGTVFWGDREVGRSSHGMPKSWTWQEVVLGSAMTSAVGTGDRASVDALRLIPLNWWQGV